LNPEVQEMGMDYNAIASSLLAGMTGNQNNFQNQQPKRGVITVAGIAEARGFNLNPGESIVLIDANDDVFYIKECDDIGKSTTRSFKYEEIEPEETSGTVSKKEFDKLSGDVKELKTLIKEIANGKHNTEKSAQ
jgi:outer membrane murein-binding lipoprotein Lpp